ncbi:class I SAM-dependent methyltransferase [Verrucomicrobiales bacterium]|nr:class I SAM-dependent methyltransferase [Verrucomicrobiales bacterium]
MNFDDALARRASILADGATDAFRVADGPADGLVPGTAIDAFAGRWLIQTKGEKPSKLLVENAAERAVSVWWKRLDQSVKESPTLLEGDNDGEGFDAREHGARYKIDFRAGYSQGIFLDQRLNRQEVRRRSETGQRVLNLFAYTGAFSVVAALGGATTTTLDLSGPYLEWAKDNFRTNGLDPADHFFCKGDALEWLTRWKKAGRTFHGIVADPPTFSRFGKSTWKVERDYAALVEACASVLEPDGWALFCANTHRASHRWFAGEISAGLAGTQHAGCALDEPGMPPEFASSDHLHAVWVG